MEIEEFISQWTEGQVRKFAAEIKEWEERMELSSVTSDWTVYQSIDGDDFRSLRAMRKIRQGETLYEIHENEISWLSEPDVYSIEHAPGIHIDCEYLAIGATNHSCKPNAAMKGLRLVAWACIEPGEEITIDYRKTETHLSNPFTCKCCGERMEW